MNLRSLLILGLAAIGTVASAQMPEMAPGELLVKFRNGRPTSLPAGYTLKMYWPQIGVSHIKFNKPTPATSLVSVFQRRSDVVYVEPNYIRHFHRTVNDPLQNQQYALTKIKAFQAWDFGIGNSNVVVAVLDSGFQLNHEDAVNKFVAGRDFMDNDNDPTWVSEPHGVETSGCVAADTNNGKGIAAIGYNVKMMPLRVGDTGIPTANSVAGMMWAADHGAKVINMSYGGPNQSQAELDASNYAWSKGLVIVASAGNSGDQGNEISYPAAYPKVISVGATDSNDQKASFSQFGPWVRVAAPGVQVMTTQPNGQYGKADGTSFSSPIVAGLAGLLWSFAPVGTTNQQIRDAIENNTDNVGNWLAKGRVNAFKAMQVFDTVLTVQAFAPTDVQPYFGNFAGGSLVSVLTNDTLTYNMNTVSDIQGQVAAVQITVPVTVTTNLRSAWIDYVANGAAGATNMVYVWNATSGRWDLIKSTALTQNGSTVSKITLPNDLTNYVSGGNMVIMSKGLAPKRPFFPNPAPFSYRVNFASVKVIPNS